MSKALFTSTPNLEVLDTSALMEFTHRNTGQPFAVRYARLVGYEQVKDPTHHDVYIRISYVGDQFHIIEQSVEESLDTVRYMVKLASRPITKYFPVVNRELVNTELLNEAEAALARRRLDEEGAPKSEGTQTKAVTDEDSPRK